MEIDPCLKYNKVLQWPEDATLLEQLQLILRELEIGVILYQGLKSQNICNDNQTVDRKLKL